MNVLFLKGLLGSPSQNPPFYTKKIFSLHNEVKDVVLQPRNPAFISRDAMSGRG